MSLAHSRRSSMAGCEAFAANHRPGDSFDGQTRYEPSPNIRFNISGNTTQKVEL